MNSSTLHLPRIPAHRAIESPEAIRQRNSIRRKIIWIVLLTIGYWFATPYYFPWTADEEASADSRAIAAQGSVERELAMPCLALLAAYMLWRSRPLPKFRGYLFNAGVLYLMVAGVSIGWSVDPAISIRRYAVYLMDVLIISALARVYSVLELARIGFFVTGFAALCALFVDAVITRAFAPWDPTYRLMGIMSSNYMGENLTVCIFSGLTLLDQDQNRRRWMVPCLCLAAGLLFITRSRTSTISCLLLSSFLIKRLVNTNVRRELRILATLALIGLGVGLVVARGNLSQMVQEGFMMGRNDTQNTSNLSNRAPLWQELSEYVALRPWFGYGFRAFWTPDRIALISAHQKWPVPNAHNTYLDEYLNTGIFGTPLFIFIFWGGLFVSWRRYLQVPMAERLYLALMISWIFLTSWFEAIPPDPFLPTALGYVCVLKAMLPPVMPAATPPVIQPGRPLPRLEGV